jgi:hypothetical protein
VTAGSRSLVPHKSRTISICVSGVQTEIRSTTFRVTFFRLRSYSRVVRVPGQVLHLVKRHSLFEKVG